jgi:hypothetical protein
MNIEIVNQYYKKAYQHLVGREFFDTADQCYRGLPTAGWKGVFES